MRHRKLVDLAKRLRLRPAYALGVLHALWHSALEQQEDGDLSKWSDEMVADFSGFTGDARQFVRHLVDSGWIDKDTRLLHDWLEYAGRYIESKYKTHNPDKLAEIWLKHGKTYLRRTKDGLKEDRRPSTYQPTYIPPEAGASAKSNGGLKICKTNRDHRWNPAETGSSLCPVCYPMQQPVEKSA